MACAPLGNHAARVPDHPAIPPCRRRIAIWIAGSNTGDVAQVPSDVMSRFCHRRSDAGRSSGLKDGAGWVRPGIDFSALIDGVMATCRGYAAPGRHGGRHQAQLLSSTCSATSSSRHATRATMRRLTISYEISLATSEPLTYRWNSSHRIGRTEMIARTG